MYDVNVLTVFSPASSGQYHGSYVERVSYLTLPRLQAHEDVRKVLADHKVLFLVREMKT